MNPLVRVEERSHYGERRLYPVSATAHAFADLLSVKTLSVGALRQIKAMGYTVEVVQPAPTVI